MSRRTLSHVAWGVAVLLSTFVLGVHGGAQGQKPAPDQPQLLMASIVTLKPGTGAQYADLQVNEIMPALKKGGAPGREVYSAGVFGEGNTMAFFSPVLSMAQFDGPSPTNKALGAEGAAALGAKGAAMIVARRTMLVRTRPDLSIKGAASEPARLALVAEVDTSPGRRAEFEALLKKEVLPVYRQAKVASYSVLEVMYGDSAGKYFAALGYDSYEALGKAHPFQAVLGEDGARRLEAKFAGIVTSLERFVVRYRPELSFSSKPGTN